MFFQPHFTVTYTCGVLCSLNESLVDGRGLGGVWVHINGLTCHIKEISVFNVQNNVLGIEATTYRLNGPGENTDVMCMYKCTCTCHVHVHLYNVLFEC